MLDGFEELPLQGSNLIQLLGLFQGFSSIISTCIQNILSFSCDLSLSDAVCLFLWFTEYKANCSARGWYILQYIVYLK